MEVFVFFLWRRLNTVSARSQERREISKFGNKLDSTARFARVLLARRRQTPCSSVRPSLLGRCMLKLLETNYQKKISKCSCGPPVVANTQSQPLKKHKLTQCLRLQEKRARHPINTRWAVHIVAPAKEKRETCSSCSKKKKRSVGRNGYRTLCPHDSLVNK